MLTHFTSFGLHQSLQVASCIHPECTPHNLSAFPSSLHPHRCALPAAPGHRGFWGMEILTIGVIIVLFVVVFKQLCILDPLPIEEGSEIDLELSAARYQPQGLDKLAAQTKFTRKELQSLYRGFKNECPSGLVDEETFKTIYSHFFPQGDSSKYAHFLFNAFDLDRSGSIRFEFPDLPAAIVDRIYRPLLCMPTVYFAQRVGIELYRQERLVTARFQLASVFHCRRAGSDFVLGLSLLLRGSVTEKLHWAFNLYDINKDGYITKEEMLAIMKSIYDMMGQYTSPRLRDEAPVEHVEKFFQKMDRNRDGVVTIEEFMETCRKDENIMNSMQLFENVI